VGVIENDTGALIEGELLGALRTEALASWPLAARWELVGVGALDASRELEAELEDLARSLLSNSWGLNAI